MTELIEFLRARLDEDVPPAAEVHAARCPAIESSGGLYAVSADSCSCRWPARVLAEVESKRQILAWLERTHAWATDNNLWSYDETEPLKIMALPYASHPDYRTEWTP